MQKKLLLSLVAATVLVVVSAIGVPSFAGGGAPAKGEGPLSLTPWKTFSTAKQGGTSVVVSTDGNVISFTSPTGSQHVFAGTPGEGYVLCYNNGAYAYDLAAVETGFGSSTRGTSNVLRSTSDGKLSLNQAFTFSAANRQLTISMTLKNLSASTVTGVWLYRRVDFDIDNDYADDWHAATVDSYFAWENHRTMLRHISAPATAIHGGGVSTLALTDPCNPVFLGQPISGDYAGTVGYGIGNIAAGKSKTVKVAYVRD